MEMIWGTKKLIRRECRRRVVRHNGFSVCQGATTQSSSLMADLFVCIFWSVWSIDRLPVDLFGTFLAIVSILLLFCRSVCTQTSICAHFHLQQIRWTSSWPWIVPAFLPDISHVVWPYVQENGKSKEVMAGVGPKQCDSLSVWQGEIKWRKNQTEVMCWCRAKVAQVIYSN